MNEHQLGEENEAMKNNSLIIVLGMMLITIGTLIYISVCLPILLPTHNDKVRKDSLEMEYNKKQLESYKYDHSKIPANDTIK